MKHVTMIAGANCAPCAALKPVLCDVCNQYGIDISIHTLTGPDDPLVELFKVRSVPTVIITYEDGAEARFTGNKSRDYIEALITESNL